MSVVKLKIEDIKEPNFVNRYGKLYIVKCPECKSENYAMAVSSGQCAWCGIIFELEKENE